MMALLEKLPESKYGRAMQEAAAVSLGRIGERTGNGQVVCALASTFVIAALRGADDPTPPESTMKKVYLTDYHREQAESTLRVERAMQARGPQEWRNLRDAAMTALVKTLQKIGHTRDLEAWVEDPLALAKSRLQVSSTELPDAVLAYAKLLDERLLEKSRPGRTFDESKLRHTFKDNVEAKLARACGDTEQAEKLEARIALGFFSFQDSKTNEPRRVFVPPNDRISAGESEDNEIRLYGRNINWKHCVFTSDNTDVYIENLYEATYLNRNRLVGETGTVDLAGNDLVIKDRHRLYSGDVIAFGSWRSENRLTFRRIEEVNVL